MELPQYTTKPSVTRMIVPEFLKMFSLSMLFYFGIKLNFYFLSIQAKSYWDVIIIAALALLSLVQVMISNSKTTAETYNFYSNRIERIGGKKPMQILFADVKNLTTAKNLFDNLFGTSKITLEPNFEMKFIKNANQIYFYIQKLIQSYRYSVYSQYYTGNPVQQNQQQAQNNQQNSQG